MDSVAAPQGSEDWASAEVLCLPRNWKPECLCFGAENGFARFWTLRIRDDKQIQFFSVVLLPARNRLKMAKGAGEIDPQTVASADIDLGRQAGLDPR